jgi:hypothetical protein
MMNEIFSFIDGNTVIHKLRLLNKACNSLLRELGPMQTKRVVTLIGYRWAPYSELLMKNLNNLLNYTPNIAIYNEIIFKDDQDPFDELV